MSLLCRLSLPLSSHISPNLFLSSHLIPISAPCFLFYCCLICTTTHIVPHCCPSSDEPDCAHRQYYRMGGRGAEEHFLDCMIMMLFSCSMWITTQGLPHKADLRTLRSEFAFSYCTMSYWLVKKISPADLAQFYWICMKAALFIDLRYAVYGPLPPMVYISPQEQIPVYRSGLLLNPLSAQLVAW